MNSHQNYKDKWQSGKWYEVETSPSIPVNKASFDWMPYEDYMKAAILYNGKDFTDLVVDFPADATEDNQMHCHPVSARCVSVVGGDGVFLYSTGNGNIEEKLLFPGVRVWMPRGILHTFKAGHEGLTVISRHTPFIPLESSKCIVYPRKNKPKTK